MLKIGAIIGRYYIKRASGLGPVCRMRMENLKSGPSWLRTQPHLATGYVQWSNPKNRRIIKILCLVLVGAAVAATWLAWVHRESVAAACQQLSAHRVMIAVLAGIASAALVSRQRSAYAARARRSWVAALPMSRRALWVEGLTVQLAPLIATLALVLGAALATAATLAMGGLPASASLIACGASLAGALLGAAGGLLIPLPKPLLPYPGSRYVPHRATHGRRPVPSVSSLGIWPIRRMFALLQPKTLSRMLLPVLAMMPLGSSAATAMIWIGIFGTLTAGVFLVGSVAWVVKVARQWLKPLPLSLQRLSWVAAIRSAIVMAGLGAAAKWLAWVGAL